MPTWGPSPLPLFARCMTVLFTPGFSSWGWPCTEATRVMGDGFKCAATGLVCSPLWGGWNSFSGIVLVCLNCFTVFICCPWNCAWSPACRTLMGLGWMAVGGGAKGSGFLTISLYFTFWRGCVPGRGSRGLPLVGNCGGSSSSSCCTEEPCCCCCCWASLSSNSLFRAPAWSCRLSSFCFKISSLKRFCSSIFKRYSLVSSSSSGNCKTVEETSLGGSKSYLNLPKMGVGSLFYEERESARTNAPQIILNWLR